MVKRITSLVMAVALVLTMSLAVFAAPAVTKINDGVFISGIEVVTKKVGEENSDGETVEKDVLAYAPGSVLTDVYNDYEPGDTINVFLDPAKFEGTDIDFNNPEKGMSVRDLERAGVTLRFTKGKNTNLIEDVALKQFTLNDKPMALIQVKLSDKITSTDSKEFETKITLMVDRRRSQEITVGGTIGSDSVPIYDGDGPVYLGDGTVGEAMDNISSIEIDAGEGVFMKARLIKGRKYYAVASHQPTQADVDVLNSEAALDTVVYLNSGGFLSNNTKVYIDTGNISYFVYNEAGDYLGKSDDKAGLALASKYWMATEELEDDVTINIGDGTSAGDTDVNEPGGGDTPTPGDGTGSGGTGSGIPDTGIGKGPQIALGATILGLATIGIVVATGKKSKKEE